jgi:hypothetical protein
MVCATIRIEPQRQTNGSDFDVHLIEEDGRQTSGILRRIDLTTGRWTANIDGVESPPATDIVTFVSGVTPAQRTHPDLLAIGQTLYEWLLPAGALRQRWVASANPRLYVETPVEALDRLPWEMTCAATPPLIRPALISGLCRLVPQGNGAAPAAPRVDAFATAP